jgi:hypothetical protein
LSIAGYICAYLPDFAFTPSVFPVLSKIDQAFVALLSTPPSDLAASAVTRSPTQTDKVRIKSLTEDTRVAAVNVAIKSGWEADLEDSEDESEVTSSDFPQAYDDFAVSAGLGRLYKGTIELLGDSLVRPQVSSRQEDSQVESGAVVDTNNVFGPGVD